MVTLQQLAQAAWIGIGATAVLDTWLLVLNRLGVPTSGFAMIGRWVGHLARGRFRHPSIAKAEPVNHELVLGWVTHYAVGVGFAGLHLTMVGMGWVLQPSLPVALATGMATVVMPLFVMQPAMGAGLASSRTAAPLKNCLRSLVNHTVFGLGLYLAALVLAWLLDAADPARQRIDFSATGLLAFEVFLQV